MASTASATPSLTPSRSPSPEPPIQPDHFYGSEAQPPASPNGDGRTWLDPEEDPLAQRGIPVFKPTMDQFRDFEAYMNKIERWGSKSGIVKVIPPKEWTDALPPLNPQLADVKLKNPIEQQMMGHGGLFRQQNIERRRVMSVREWAEWCAQDELRAPGVDDIGLHARSTNGTVKPRTRRGRRKTREPETAEPEVPVVVVKEEDNAGDLGISVAHVNDATVQGKSLAPPLATVVPEPALAADDPDVIVADAAANEQGPSRPSTPVALEAADTSEVKDEQEEAESRPPKRKGRRVQTKEEREAALAERAEKDKAFLEDFDPHVDWLPPNTSKFDYTPEFCKELERRYWRNCGIGKAPWYGADMQGSLFTDETQAWNVGHLQSTLSRLLPTSRKGLPGVNTPYLYFGMWRATFAWHVEDMDLFSINYIHFGAPKFWYAVPQARAGALEQTMKGYFQKDTACPQFLRHKSYLASPMVLTSSSCRPNFLVQQEGEFVITYPRGYHAGFNLGFNCAESVNFALDSWLDKGRTAKICECVDFSVRIDVDQLLLDREAERAQAQAKAAVVQDQVQSLDLGETIDKVPETPKAVSSSPRKRKSEAKDGEPKPKRPRNKAPKSAPAVSTTPTSPTKTSPTKASKVTLKLGPKPQESDVFPCCLCVSSSRANLLRVYNPPRWQKEGQSGDGGSTSEAVWYAHAECADVIPETWTDTIESGSAPPDGVDPKERMVFGTDAIPKDRWSLKCSLCSKTRYKAHGAPIQCTKGKCPKAYHVSCARDGAEAGVSYTVVGEVENDVLSTEQPQPSADGDAVMETEEPRVLSLVKKLEVELLCPQHNPIKMEARKAAKQNRIRNMLLELPPMTRIKLRVSAGVFEVSLVRVVEESSSVEVLWDRGHKREFKWSSVVFGNTGGVVVGQKPAELAVEPERPPAPVPTSASAPAPTPATATATASAVQPPASTSFYLPLGTSASMEVRSSLTRPQQQYGYPAASAPEASTSGSGYGQRYPPNYYQAYSSTQSYPPNAYSGQWSYQYAGQPNTVPSQTSAGQAPTPPSSHAPTAYPTGQPSGQPYPSSYSTGAYSYSYPSGSYYTPTQTPATHQNTSAYSQQPPGQYAPQPQYTAAQQQTYAQYTPGMYAGYAQTGPASTSAHQDPQDNAPYMREPSHVNSRSHTPSIQGLRWQRPYEGPKTASRASSSKSRSTSQSAVALPPPPRRSHETTPALDAVPSANSMAAPTLPATPSMT